MSQPRLAAICDTAQSVSEPTLVTATVRPRSWSIAATELSGRTISTRMAGGPDSAATALSGAPLAAKASVAPPASAMSMLPATDGLHHLGLGDLHHVEVEPMALQDAELHAEVAHDQGEIGGDLGDCEMRRGARHAGTGGRQHRGRAVPQDCPPCGNRARSHRSSPLL